MNTYTIHLDDLAYGGEIEDEHDAADVGAGGWHQPNQGSLGRIAVGGALKRITGRRNLASELDRILRRMERGEIQPTEIVIRAERSDAR